MKKNEIIEHWAGVVMTVLTAEVDLQPALKEELKGGKITPLEYCRRIAEEILSKTPREELERLYDYEENE